MASCRSCIAVCKDWRALICGTWQLWQEADLRKKGKGGILGDVRYSRDRLSGISRVTSLKVRDIASYGFGVYELCVVLNYFPQLTQLSLAWPVHNSSGHGSALGDIFLSPSSH